MIGPALCRLTAVCTNAIKMSHIIMDPRILLRSVPKSDSPRPWVRLLTAPLEFAMIEVYS
jgi:hypothetical protein